MASFLRDMFTRVVQRGGGHGDFPGIHAMLYQMRIRIFLQGLDGIAGILLAGDRRPVYKPGFRMPAIKSRFLLRS